MTKIAISTPAYGEIFYASYVQSLFGLVRAFEQRQWGSLFASISYTDIVESRNFLLTHWFDRTDATHLLFLDADMGFAPQLVIDMLAFEKPLVGVVYPKRQIDLDRLMKLSAEGVPAPRALARSHDFIVRRNTRSAAPDRNGFVEVDGCGCGVMLIRRDCVEEMLRRFPDLSDRGADKTAPIAKGLDRLIRAFDPLVVDGARLSEDYAFCHRWRQCGGEVWAGISHEITHVGLHKFKGRYKDARAGQRITIAPPGAGRRGASDIAATPVPKRVITGTIQRGLGKTVPLNRPTVVQGSERRKASASSAPEKE